MTNRLPVAFERDTLLLRLAREVATDLHPIDEILKTHSVEAKDWEAIKSNPRFLRLLEAELKDWNAAGNTPERVKLKAAMLIEEWLPAANALAHGSDTLSSKTELMKFLASLAQMGKGHGDAGQASEGFRITINLGADAKLKFEKRTTPEVIDVTPTQETT